MSSDRRSFLGQVLALGVGTLVDWRLLAESEGLPSYYGDYLFEVASRVRAGMASSKDGFWFLTDVHVPSNRKISGRVLARLIVATGLKKVLFGGDVVGAFGTRQDVLSAMDDFRLEWIDPIESVGGRLYIAKGNHDFTIRESLSSKSGFTLDARAARSYLLGTHASAHVTCNENDPEGCYYYFDESEARIRYIVADTTDSIDLTRTCWAVAYGVHERQLTWLQGRAFGTLPTGYSIVLMHHIPVTGVVGNDDDERRFANLRKLIEKYSSRIILDVTGHHHCEMQTCQNGVWHVTNPCDAMYRDYIARSRPWCPNLPLKAGGTIYENTFDAVLIGRADEDLRFVRVGGGNDRRLVRAITQVHVGESHQFVSDLQGVTWGCYDADRVTNKRDPDNRYGVLCEYHNTISEISETGVLTGRKAGESVVVALAADGRKQLFPVRVLS